MKETQSKMTPDMLVELLRKLAGADLTHIDLRQHDLSGLHFSGLVLHRADFAEANLKRAILIEANLSRADFQEADLTNAEMGDAILEKANLDKAILDGAGLSGANLRDALVTPEQLATVASLQGAIMPDGTKHA